MDTFAATTSYFTRNDIAKSWPKHDISKYDFGMGGPIARQYYRIANIGDVFKGYAETDIQ